MSDRILVMHEGTVAGILDADEADAEAVMALATTGGAADSRREEFVGGAGVQWASQS